MSFTPFAAPILSGLLSDKEVTSLFSIREEIETMIGIEGALALSQAKAGVISQGSAQAILNGFADFEPDLAKLTEGTARDGVVVPELVRQLRAHVGEPHAEVIHHGATSQDIVDTSFVIKIKALFETLDSRLSTVESTLEALSNRFGKRSLMGRTRMQAALPLSVADRISSWQAPLAAHRQRLKQLAPRLLVLQFGGAVGSLDKLGDKAVVVSQYLADDLKLGLPPKPWHSDRSTIAELASFLSLITGSLGKIGQDICLMAQNEIAEIKLSETGGSSAMPHKQNPVLAEVLVTLARFNATQLVGVHSALVHEQERSGAAWTLEWMLLPQMCVATGSALRNAAALLESVEALGESS